MRGAEYPDERVLVVVENVILIDEEFLICEEGHSASLNHCAPIGQAQLKSLRNAEGTATMAAHLQVSGIITSHCLHYIQHHLNPMLARVRLSHRITP